MAADSYSAQVIVLRKTKLGESDLILSLLAEDGSQIRAVAKGARKPSSPFAARLELYSIAEVLCSKGRNLDIIKEARLLESNKKLRSDIEHSAGAAAMAELLDKVTQLGLSNPKLYDMTRRAFFSLEKGTTESVPTITAAQLLKTLAFSGFRPSLGACVFCGLPIDLERSQGNLAFSYREGGVVCAQCASSEETQAIPTELLRWSFYLLNSTFKEIEGQKLKVSIAFDLLQFCRSWIREHVGSNIKSFDFIFTCGLYEREKEQ